LRSRLGWSEADGASAGKVSVLRRGQVRRQSRYPRHDPIPSSQRRRQRLHQARQLLRPLADGARRAHVPAPRARPAAGLERGHHA
jgi:hypothetical protein